MSRRRRDKRASTRKRKNGDQGAPACPDARCRGVADAVRIRAGLDKRAQVGLDRRYPPPDSMSRKYQQPGYQEDERDRPGRVLDRDRRPEGDGRPRRGYGSREPRAMNMPAFREVMKCARCGQALDSTYIRFDTQCEGCGADLHSCAQCTWFDTSRTLECAQPIPKRVSPKDARNDCTFFEARVTVERETHSRATPGPAVSRDARSSTSSSAGPSEPAPDAASARQAFDDLFK